MWRREFLIKNFEICHWVVVVEARILVRKRVTGNSVEGFSPLPLLFSQLTTARLTTAKQMNLVMGLQVHRQRLDGYAIRPLGWLRHPAL